MMDALTMARFRKVCGLLGSNHEGERAAAALKATAILKAAGKTWADVGCGGFSVQVVEINQTHLAGYWESMYRGERAQSEDRAKEIRRLKREVARLKGMWPKGRPGRAA